MQWYSYLLVYEIALFVALLLPGRIKDRRAFTKAWMLAVAGTTGIFIFVFWVATFGLNLIVEIFLSIVVWGLFATSLAHVPKALLGRQGAVESPAAKR